MKAKSPKAPLPLVVGIYTFTHRVGRLAVDEKGDLFEIFRFGKTERASFCGSIESNCAPSTLIREHAELRRAYEGRLIP